MHIDRLVPPLVLQELRRDGLSVRDVAQDCWRLVSAAWAAGMPALEAVGLSGAAATRTGLQRGAGRGSGRVSPSRSSFGAATGRRLRDSPRWSGSGEPVCDRGDRLV